MQEINHESHIAAYEQVLHAAAMITGVFLTVVAVWHSFSFCQVFEHSRQQGHTLAGTFTALVKAVCCALAHIYMQYHSIALHKYMFFFWQYMAQSHLNTLICIIQYKYFKYCHRLFCKRLLFFLSVITKSLEHSLFLHQQSTSHTQLQYFIWYNHYMFSAIASVRNSAAADGVTVTGSCSLRPIKDSKLQERLSVQSWLPWLLMAQSRHKSSPVALSLQSIS